MIYTTEKIQALAAMSHIALSEAEVERMRHELGAMHAFAEALQNAPLEAEGEDPFLDSVPLSALREDIPGTCLPPERLLPGKGLDTPYFTVPRTVEE